MDGQYLLRSARKKALRLNSPGINVAKTKELRIRTPANARSTTINNDDIELVDSFTYLGSIVSKTGGTDEDIAARMRKANGAFAMLRPIWRSKHISVRLKLRIFHSNVQSVLLYGAETWKLTKRLTSKLQSFVNRKLRFPGDEVEGPYREKSGSKKR